MTKTYVSFNNDSDDEMIGMRQALPVPALPNDFNPNVPPTSGEEYIQHVVFEAKKFSPVLTAERIKKTILNSPCDINVVSLKPKITSSSLAPNAAWENQQISKFSHLRNIVHDLRLAPGLKEKLANSAPHVNALGAIWKEFLFSNKPLLSVVLSISQEQLERALQVLLEIHTSGDFNVDLGAWVYAICACLDHPLSREACGDLRDIARKCASDRNKKVGPTEYEVAMWNLIITIVVKYFKQEDLREGS